MKLWNLDTIPRSRIQIQESKGDSIIFEDNYQNQIFKRIPDSLKSKESLNQKLENKIFELSLFDIKDTIVFGKNKIFLKRKDSEYFKWTNDPILKSTINGFQIIQTSLSTHLVKKDKDTLCLYALNDKNKWTKISLKEIKLDSIDMESLSAYKQTIK